MLEFMNATDTGATTESMVDAFRALADPLRLRLIALLIRSGESLCVCEIGDALDEAQYKVSRHLAVLRQTNLVTTRKQGTWIYYSLHSEDAFLHDVFELLNRNLDASVYERDEALIRARLSFRADGRCVIGNVPETELEPLVTKDAGQDAAAKCCAEGDTDDWHCNDHN